MLCSTPRIGWGHLLYLEHLTLVMLYVTHFRRLLVAYQTLQLVPQVVVLITAFA